MSDLLEYKLPKTAYVNFDAVSLKQFIIDKLNENPNFTDQNYEGSNLASFIDIIAYSYHVLLFYLNQTSSETVFSQASLYENINKIVKFLNYKPTGKQTSLATVSCQATSDLAIGNYTLRKYSYILIDSIQYNILENFSFDKTQSGSETIQSIEDNLVLYQGSIGEYPLYTADGIDFETFPIVVDNIVNKKDDRFIAHGTISVYVKEFDTNTWYEYKESQNLYLNNGSERTFDLRLNENGHYEVKFGNNIFGKRLNKGDIVAVYYILSDNEKGIISKGSISGNKIFNFNTSQFSEIYNDTNDVTNLTLIDRTNNSFLNFTNNNNSTPIQEQESVEDIKNNLPILVNSNISLINETEYDYYINKNLSNFINSVKTVNNNRFINEYIDYFYKICIDPNKTNRVILNQLNFANSCNFNNVNIFCVPKFKILNDGEYPPFVNDSLKRLLVDSLLPKKILNHEIVPRDPVYKAFDIGYTEGTISKDIYLNSYIQITRDQSVKISKETIKNRIIKIILDFFDASNNSLGEEIDISNLTTSILTVEGVKHLKTINGSDSYNGLSFITWNPLYDGVDESLITQSTTLPFFVFPYFYRPNSLTNKIIVTDNA